MEGEKELEEAKTGVSSLHARMYFRTKRNKEKNEKEDVETVRRHTLTSSYTRI